MRKDTPPTSPNPFIDGDDEDDLEYIGDLQDLPDDYLGDEVRSSYYISFPNQLYSKSNSISGGRGGCQARHGL